MAVIPRGTYFGRPLGEQKPKDEVKKTMESIKDHQNLLQEKSGK